VDQINNRLLEDIVAQLQGALHEFEDGGAIEAAEPDVARYAELEPSVLVSLFRGETQMLGGRRIELTDFYAPAVVVVLLQHLAVTLLGLSVVRERALGVTELFRVSPMRTFEYVLGKFAAYLLLGGVIGFVLLAALVGGLGTPMAGEWLHVAAVLVVLLFTATAAGLTLSLLANNDSQAVQYAMLVLLATIFLSGFLLSLDRFLPFARPLAWLLPATHAIALVRDIMFRGAPIDLVVLGGLAAYGVLFTAIAVMLAHRKLNTPGM